MDLLFYLQDKLESVDKERKTIEDRLERSSKEAEELNPQHDQLKAKRNKLKDQQRSSAVSFI